MKDGIEISQSIESDSNDDFFSIEAHSDEGPELSLAETTFEKLQIFQDGFKPTFFSNTDIARLSAVSSAMHDVVEPERHKRLRIPQLLLTEQLLSHVVRGEESKAHEVIEANPELLIIESQVVDYSGRIIIATPFQAALGAEDERMWTMMLPFFDSLEQQGLIESAKEELRQQFEQQFFDGIESQSAEELGGIYNQLAQDIIAGNGEAAILVCREIITQHDTVTHGKHFNVQHLLAAYQAYTKNYDALAASGNWDNRIMFWTKVIGYVQRQISSVYAQAICSGIENVLDNPAELKRTFSFADGGFFFPLNDNAGLGFHFACLSVRNGFTGYRWRGGPVYHTELLKTYVQQKQKSLIEFKSSLDSEVFYQASNS